MKLYKLVNGKKVEFSKKDYEDNEKRIELENQKSIDLEATQYERDREKEFKKVLGNWEDQLDMIYHDIKKWKAEVKKIKEKFPKP